MPSKLSSAMSAVTGRPRASASSAVAAAAVWERVSRVWAAARGEETRERSSAIADHQATRCSRRPTVPAAVTRSLA